MRYVRQGNRQQLALLVLAGSVLFCPILRADPMSITTTAGGAVVLGSGIELTDSATLAGGSDPAGTLTFYLFAPGITPDAHDSNSLYRDLVTVTGDGIYTTGSGSNPGGYSPTSDGVYEWLVVYSGDTNNSPDSSLFGSEPQTVTTAASAVPEPSSILLLCSIIAAMAFGIRSRKSIVRQAP
jgi:hypothetical protein